MSGYYAKNPHYAPDRNDPEGAERIERCEAEAGRWFDDATTVQRGVYQDRIEFIRPWKGSPRWERERDAAVSMWKADTAAASALYERTLAELLSEGEVSEALANEWAALQASQNAPRLIQVGDHDPELAWRAA